MNGPEHYAEAERLIGRSNDPDACRYTFPRTYLAAAQVHATLALAAATAEAAFDPTGRALVCGRYGLEWGTVLYPPEELSDG